MIFTVVLLNKKKNLFIVLFSCFLKACLSKFFKNYMHVCRIRDKENTKHIFILIQYLSNEEKKMN